MDHLLRFQRRMHVKLTPVARKGGQIQPLESVIMILVKKPGNLVRQKGNNVVFSQFASIPMQNAFVPEGIVAVYAPTLQIMLQMSACLGTLSATLQDVLFCRSRILASSHVERF